jgi:hypothetical protein
VELTRRYRPAGQTKPQTEAAGTTVPTTVLLGRDDDLMSDADRQPATAAVDDLKKLDTDHFILFRSPEVVSTSVMEALEPVR